MQRVQDKVHLPETVMDHGSILARAWRVTWRHRSLWLLALFAPIRLPLGTALLGLPSGTPW